MKRLVISILTLVTSIACSHSSNHPASAAGTPLLTSPEVVKPLMLKTFQYQIADQAKKKPDADWIRAAFYLGVTSAYRATGETLYFNHAMDWAANQGHWSPSKGDWRFADHYCNAQVYCDLFAMKQDPKMIAASRANFDRIIAHPLPGRVDWWWCDSLFMGPAGFVEMSAVTGDRKYVDFADGMYWDAVDFLYAPQHQLFFRDHRYFDKKTANGQPVFWSRGNGWVYAGLAHILQYLPANYPTRHKYIELFQDMSDKLIAIQGPDGVLRSSLLDPNQFPTPETSGSAFFTFGLAWGINHHLLDRDKYLPNALRGYAGLCALVDSNGKLTHVQSVAGEPGKVNPQDTHEYAVGGFLMASSEMLKLKPTAKEESSAFHGFSPPPRPTTQPAP